MKKKIIYSVLLIALAGGGYLGYKVFGSAVTATAGKYLFIKTGSSYSDVRKDLNDLKIVKDDYWFNLIAEKLSYNKLVKAGRYEIKSGMSLYSLVRMLRAGNQSPVNFTINKIRLKEDLAAKVGNTFECDSLSFISLLSNADSLKRYGLDDNTLLTVVIPNTYSMSWNASPEKIFKKLYADQEKFWDDERKKKAAALNLTPKQVYTMASIVEEETNKEEDKGKIASVYINRIETGMKLGADPTVKFAMKDFGLKRILFEHLKFSSPYNTYVNFGLPPGPICTPSVKTIDAVLNAPQTDYVYFVAKPDFSGGSNFATNYADHLKYAHDYQMALDSLIRAKAAKAAAQNNP